VAYTDEPLRVVVHRLADNGLTGFPLGERQGNRKLVGMVSLNGLLRARSQRSGTGSAPCAPVCRLGAKARGGASAAFDNCGARKAVTETQWRDHSSAPVGASGKGDSGDPAASARLRRIEGTNIIGGRNAAVQGTCAGRHSYWVWPVRALTAAIVLIDCSA
jgi:hypothetical protein